MVVVFIVHRFHPNLFFPVKSLKDAGHQVHLIVPNRSMYDILSEDHSVVVPHKLNNDQINFKNVYKLLKTLKPDIIIQRHFEGKWKLFSWMAFFLGIKRVTYDLSPQTGDSFIKQKSRPIRRVFRGHPLKKMTPILNKGRIGRYTEPFSVYIPFPIEPFFEEERSFQKSQPLKILCIGKLGERRKRHLFLLDALEKMNIPCSLTFVGTGPEFIETDKEYYELLEKRCKESKLSGGVELLMDLSYKEMILLYEKYDLLIMPAVRESLGQCVLEGLAAGLPVISTDDCGAAGYILDGFNGFVFDRNSIDDLIDKVLFFAQNPMKLEEFSNHALLRIKTEHAPFNFVRRIEKL